MPLMICVYLRSAAIGFLLGVCFVAALLVLDVATLRHLILNGDGGWLAAIMLVVANGIVFAGVQFAITIMTLAEKPQTPGGRSGFGRLNRDPVAQLASARITRRRR